MPAAPANSLVLVTGASGFLAAHVSQQLLQRGYSVRGTVRSRDKGEYLKKLYEKDGLTNFEYVLVEDMEKDGAYDDAVKGCDAVAHTSSPFHFNVEDPHKDLINPARFGTLNLLQSAAKEPKIQRVVITSSFASIVTPKDPVYTFTEDDWNTYSPKLVEEQGKNTDGSQVYRASKVIAEKAAWEFIEKEKPNWDIATINPPLILGPIIHECKSPESLNTSIAAFWAYLNGNKSDEDATQPAGMYVDVRDVAKCHVDALATPEAGNKRFCISAASYHWQPLLDIMHEDKQADLRKQFPKLIRGKPGCPAPKQNQIDSSRAKELFGWQPIPEEKMVVDMAASLAEYQKQWK